MCASTYISPCSGGGGGCHSSRSLWVLSRDHFSAMVPRPVPTPSPPSSHPREKNRGRERGDRLRITDTEGALVLSSFPFPPPRCSRTRQRRRVDELARDIERLLQCGSVEAVQGKPASVHVREWCRKRARYSSSCLPIGGEPLLETAWRSLTRAPAEWKCSVRAHKQAHRVGGTEEKDPKPRFSPSRFRWSSDNTFNVAGSSTPCSKKREQ